MTVIEKYLYNNFTYKIYSGRVPFLVGDQTVFSDTSVPGVVWNIDFGKVTSQFKNAIEEGIFTDYNDLYLMSYVGPAYMIGKNIDILTLDVTYYLSYVFEYEYYGSFVNKSLDYIVDGSDHLIEGSIRIPINQLEGDEPIVINTAELKRRLHFLSSELSIVHHANDINALKASFTEQASPLNIEAFVVGVSNANHSSSC